MLFYKVLILFWGCKLGGSKNALLQYLSPQPGTNGSINSGFDEGPPSKKQNVLWMWSVMGITAL